LHAAHEAKNEQGETISLIHRDVSPQNVLVGTDGIARVLDFGVAKAAGRVQVTREGQIKGKLAYMPPDQVHGRPLTRAVDLYAAAVVLWETLTGDRLFKGANEAETLKKLLAGHVAPPSSLVAGISESFDDVVMRGLGKKEPAFATAREMAVALEKCVGIASPTEVSEWVERMCGDILAEREEQIAEIESESTSLSGLEESSASDASGSLPALPSVLPLAPVRSDAPVVTDTAALQGSMSEIVVVHETARPTLILGPAAAENEESSPGSASLLAARIGSKRSWSTAALLSALVLMFLAGGVAVGLSRPSTTGGVTGRERAPLREQEYRREPAFTAAVPSPPLTPAAAQAVPSSSPGSPAGSSVGVGAAPAPAPAEAAAASAPMPQSAKAATSVQLPQGASSALGAKPRVPGAPPAACDPPWEIDAKGHKHYKLACLDK
jgi:serine/threonine-protein kinase